MTAFLRQLLTLKRSLGDLDPKKGEIEIDSSLYSSLYVLVYKTTSFRRKIMSKVGKYPDLTKSTSLVGIQMFLVRRERVEGQITLSFPTPSYKYYITLCL